MGIVVEKEESLVLGGEVGLNPIRSWAKGRVIEIPEPVGGAIIEELLVRITFREFPNDIRREPVVVHVLLDAFYLLGFYLWLESVFEVFPVFSVGADKTVFTMGVIAHKFDLVDYLYLFLG